jgi:hypothetical protein
MHHHLSCFAAFPVVALLAAAADRPALSGPPAADAGVRPVLVELFTSQGCSSCPPADRLLGRLGAEDGGHVIALAFHVDYWNHGGWSDPFSSRRWSQRQERYARRFHLDAPYTPQAVIEGAVEMVGSRETDLRSAIAARAARPAAVLAVRVFPAASGVRVDVDVERAGAVLEKKLDLMVAVFETGLVTPVKGGENGGRTLRNDDVVRDLSRAARLAAGGPARTEQTVEIRPEKEWNRDALGVAVFLQDPNSLEIFGAAQTLLPSIAVR